VCLTVDTTSRGNFADDFGEDFLGLRELGIAAEYGLSKLSIPKRLLKGKGRGENKHTSSAYVPFACRHSESMNNLPLQYESRRTPATVPAAPTICTAELHKIRRSNRPAQTILPRTFCLTLYIYPVDTNPTSSSTAWCQCKCPSSPWCSFSHRSGSYQQRPGYFTRRPAGSLAC
jgi:hypothetical protein